ncbi:hypothetical protein I308_104081 [Cryptococcus tetragattii IND107]|uniref:N-acetyltransferase domain-containing protein n=1 Tax=Cryptococcus tetragattii IND107 TaxID=1296105 RepID=A0ABR3BPC8_9TREE|nr:hypothetical protein I308_00667 [Cryptococcus tetragattii IND107]
MASAIEIKTITAQQTTPIRHLVLWPSIALESQLDPAYDFAPTSIHLGAFLSSSSEEIQLSPEYLPRSSSTASPQEPIGIMTLALQPYCQLSSVTSPSFITPSLIHVQLHKFAVHPDLRGLGFGRTMFAHAISLLKEKYGEGNVLFHFDARANQTRFYGKCGMDILDPIEFEKRGTTGKEAPVIHIKMGRVI